MGRPGRLVWLALLLQLGGCKEVVSVEARGTATVLVGVVVSFADSAFVTLGRSEPGASARGEPGARLELVVDGASVPLEEGPAGGCGRPSGFSCYRGELAGRADPGDVVRVRGVLASGAEVRGEAALPPVPALSVEGAGPGDTVRMSLSDGGPAPELLGLDGMPGRVGTADTTVAAMVWAGERTLSCVVHLPGPPPGFDLRRAFRVGVAANRPYCAGEPDVSWDSLALRRTFMLYDANFTAWADLSHQVQGDGGIGVDGVSGVFGAATPRVFVMVVRP